MHFWSKSSHQCHVPCGTIWDKNSTPFGWNCTRSCTSTTMAHQSYSKRNLPKMHMAWMLCPQHQLWHSIYKASTLANIDISIVFLLASWCTGGRTRRDYIVGPGTCCTVCTAHSLLSMGTIKHNVWHKNHPSGGHLDSPIVIYVTGE